VNGHRKVLCRVVQKEGSVMHVFVYCIRICIYTFNVYTHMFIQKSSVCIDRDTYMRALCREVQKEGSMIYMFIYCIRICIHTNTHIQIRILYKQKSFVCINKYTFMRALCRKVQKEGSVMYIFICCMCICMYTCVYTEELCMYR